MSEESMVALCQHALEARGIGDRVQVAGEFYPRGHTGGGFAGGLVGGDAGGMAGGLAESVGVVGGALAGQRAGDAASGLPSEMLVAVSDSTVYGLAVRHRNSEPTQLAFQVPRSGLEVKVHQRVNVRILELIDEATGSRIELEGSRIPLTHSKGVIEALGD